jgi:hypothetical protein
MILIFVILSFIYSAGPSIPMRWLGECSGYGDCYVKYMWTLFTAPISGDPFLIAIYLFFVFIFLFLFNYGFRVFEWDEERFCMKSWFGKRCYKWNELDRVIVSTKFGAKWIFLVVWDNFYYTPYHGTLDGVLREICEKKKISIEVINDPYPALQDLRKRRKEHGTHMMLFQP